MKIIASKDLQAIGDAVARDLDQTNRQLEVLQVHHRALSSPEVTASLTPRRIAKQRDEYSAAARDQVAGAWDTLAAVDRLPSPADFAGALRRAFLQSARLVPGVRRKIYGDSDPRQMQHALIEEMRGVRDGQAKILEAQRLSRATIAELGEAVDDASAVDDVEVRAARLHLLEVEAKARKDDGAGWLRARIEGLAAEILPPHGQRDIDTLTKIKADGALLAESLGRIQSGRVDDSAPTPPVAAAAAIDELVKEHGEAAAPILYAEQQAKARRDRARVAGAQATAEVRAAVREATAGAGDQGAAPVATIERGS
jgi:hypothetical protein